VIKLNPKGNTISMRMLFKTKILNLGDNLWPSFKNLEKLVNRLNLHLLRGQLHLRLILTSPNNSNINNLINSKELLQIPAVKQNLTLHLLVLLGRPDREMVRGSLPRRMVLRSLTRREALVLLWPQLPSDSLPLMLQHTVLRPTLWCIMHLRV
jgi:hypothetical protein